eukprot:6212136-Pleurochrysis_carterae.AAC.4
MAKSATITTKNALSPNERCHAQHRNAPRRSAGVARGGDEGGEHGGGEHGGDVGGTHGGGACAALHSAPSVRVAGREDGRSLGECGDESEAAR